MNCSITKLIPVFALAFLSGCSFSSTPDPAIKDLPGIAQASKESHIAVESFTDLTRVYRLHGLTSQNDIFFTAINDCREKGTSLQNLISKMLVGFKSPALTNQTNLTFKHHKVLRSVIATERDNEVLYMMIYTVSKSGCVSDYAIWSQTDFNQLSKRNQDQLDTFIAELVDRRK